MRTRLTQTLVQKAEPRGARYTLFDDMKGFMLRVEPSGQKLYYIDYIKPDGKRSSYKLGSAEILTVAQAREAAREFLASLALGEDPRAQKIEAPVEVLAFGALVDELYDPWVVVNRKSGAATVAMLKRSFGFLWDVPIPEISIMRVEEWKIERRRASIKSASVNRQLTALKAVLNWGFKRGLFDANPLARLERLQERDSQPKVRYLSDEERVRLMAALDEREERIRRERDGYNKWLAERKKDALPDLWKVTYADHLKPMILISLNTGIRRGALFSLRWGDVDLAGRILTLRSEEDKAGKVNHVPINGVAFDAFDAWRRQSEKAGDKDLVFPSPKNGERMGNCTHGWGTIMKMAGIENFRWHDMRHDFASQLVMKGVDLNTVRELMGHADLKMTLRYAHLAPKVKMRAVELLN